MLTVAQPSPVTQSPDRNRKAVEVIAKCWPAVKASRDFVPDDEPFCSSLVCHGGIAFTEDKSCRQERDRLRMMLKKLRRSWNRYRASRDVLREVRCLFFERHFRRELSDYLKRFRPVEISNLYPLRESDNGDELNRVERRLLSIWSRGQAISERSKERQALAEFQRYRRSIEAQTK
jgi:hypothetical protein